jgi:hypothetical protein
MGIAAAFTTVIGALSSPTAIAGATLLTGANTVMNAVELKNDSDIKAGINNANSKLVKVQDSLDELQGICANTCTMDDIESMFAAPAAPTPTTTSTPSPAPTQTPAAPAPDNDMPAWAQQIMQQMYLMQQQNAAPANTAPSNTTVNVNPTATPTPTTAPAAPAATTTPASTPAPQPAGESVLETKLDKLIEGFGVLVDSLKANSGNAPTTGSSDTAKTGA